MKLKMGTRGSALALAQSGWAAREIERLTPGLKVETVVIKTSGDLFAAQTPQAARALAAGTKGLFIKEIEEALCAGQIDFAVHSAKDLPAGLAPGLLIAAYPEREDPRDVFIGGGGAAWASMGGGSRIGTSSPRRKVQLLAAKPGLSVLPLRGNVDTRLRKLEEGQFDGLVLALAGLKRLGRNGVPHEPLSTEVVLPAPAQGALAVEARSDRGDVLAALKKLDHARTRLEVEFERAFLAALGGGCSMPLGALAKARGKGVHLTVFWSEPDGGSARRLAAFCEGPADREAFAADLAARVRA